jgi:hypothetical protein
MKYTKELTLRSGGKISITVDAENPSEYDKMFIDCFILLFEMYEDREKNKVVR